MQPNKISYILCALIAIASGFALFFYFSHRDGTGDAPMQENAASIGAPGNASSNSGTPIIRLGGQDFFAHIADSSEKRQRGLSGKKELPENRAMLFVFESDGFHAFWMKDMLVPIDMIWLDSDKRIVHIVKNADPASYPNVFKPQKQSRYVLEAKAGTSDRLNLRINDKAEW